MAAQGLSLCELVHTFHPLWPVRHYPHLRISVRGPGPSGTSTHLTRQLPGTRYGLLRTDQDRVLLRFVEGRPVSRVTTTFLAWVAHRLAKDGKRVWVLVWDNATWHVSQAVQGWIRTHNRTVKRTGGVRILVCRLPVKSPWLNPIEPRWLHGKRAIVEPERTLTADELMDRVHQHFRCEHLELLHQHVL